MGTLSRSLSIPVRDLLWDFYRGRISIAGFAIAFTIRSVDRSLSIRLILIGRLISVDPSLSSQLAIRFIVFQSINKFDQLVAQGGASARHQSSPHRFEGCRCPLLRRICAATAGGNLFRTWYSLD